MEALHRVQQAMAEPYPDEWYRPVLYHGHDIIHRDIKPANIVLDGVGSLKLTDFDLVHADDTTGGTRTGVLGTYGYAAPEQMQRPQDVDVRADVYGLGMTAVFALHGADPSLYEILRNANGFIDSLAVSDRVKSVLSRLIAWEVGERYPSVADFCAALREARQVKPPALVSGMPPLAVSVPTAEDPPGTDPDARPPLGPPLSRPARERRLGPEMIWLPGGTFRMGSPAGVGSKDERPAHDVTLSHYAVGQYPVTVGEFRRFCAATGYRTAAEQGSGAFVLDKGKWKEKKDANWQNPYFAQDDRHPVVCISWTDAQAYCDWLSRGTGQTYGLLSEAQWEYACRAGSDTRYYFGDDEAQLGDYAWYSRNAGDHTHPVGEKRANAWGLYDLHGNAWEWCQDWYAHDYQQFASGAERDSQSARREASVTEARASSGEQSMASDPSGPESGSSRAVRGGSWGNSADRCRSADRNSGRPSDRYYNLGFRLSRTGPLHSYPFTLVPSEPEPEPRPIPNLRDPLRDGAAGPAMVWLPGGTFTMGQDDSQQEDEKPPHPVRVGAFSIGHYPVTFAEYDRFCAATGRAQPQDQGWGRDRQPAINVRAVRARQHPRLSPFEDRIAWQSYPFTLVRAAVPPVPRLRIGRLAAVPRAQPRGRRPGVCRHSAALMLVRVFTLSFDRATTRFNDDPVRDFVADTDDASIRDHVFLRRFPKNFVPRGLNRR